ncbi:MAG: 50S ribosomal protein L22, partial [Candidatus Eremiobacteraeota bacterium]|nr:50S ribosomal protein L22 [Candidatus Eremiobacteraeota bacterium]
MGKVKAVKGEPETQVRAVAKYIRTSPRKMRLVADMIRGKSAQEAWNILEFTPKRAT